MIVKTSPFDPAEHLKTPEDIAAFLEAVFEDEGDDPVFIQKALGVAARAGPKAKNSPGGSWRSSAA